MPEINDNPFRSVRKKFLRIRRIPGNFPEFRQIFDIGHPLTHCHVADRRHELVKGAVGDSAAHGDFPVRCTVSTVAVTEPEHHIAVQFVIFAEPCVFPVVAVEMRSHACGTGVMTYLFPACKSSAYEIPMFGTLEITIAPENPLIRMRRQLLHVGGGHDMCAKREEQSCRWSGFLGGGMGGDQFIQQFRIGFIPCFNREILIGNAVVVHQLFHGGNPLRPEFRTPCRIVLRIVEGLERAIGGKSDK